VASLESQTIARKGSSVLRLWPPRFALNYPFISGGAWAPPPISTECDGRWSRWQFLFSPCPDVSRLVIHSNYVWQAVFSSGEAGGGSKAPRRAPPVLPSDLGKTPFHTPLGHAISGPRHLWATPPLGHATSGPRHLWATPPLGHATSGPPPLSAR